MNQKKAILIHTVHKFHSQREVWQCRHVFLTGYPEMSSGILKGERPRVCPAPGHCTTALAQMLTVAEVGRALGGSAGGNGTAVGKVERSKTGPEAVHAPPPRSPTLGQGPARHGRRGAQALGAAAPSAAHRGISLGRSVPRDTDRPSRTPTKARKFQAAAVTVA